MKKLKYVLVILLLISLCYFLIKYIDYRKKINYKEEITIKIGDSLPTIYNYVDKDDIKKIKNKNISWKDINISDNKVYYTGIYKGIFNFNNKDITIKLNVIDDVAPSIEGVKDIEIYINEKIDLFKDIKIGDNSKDKLDIKIDGNYNINKKGEYNLKYVVTDKSNNKTQKDFKLTVKEKNIITVNPSKKINGTTSKGYKIEQKNSVYYINGILIANKTYKLSNNYNPGGLLSSFMTNFNQMKNDASKEKINLKIISGFRSYNTQATLYNNYVKRDGKKEADTYSARAGHSEHQTGLAADINSLNQSFINTTEGKWLNNNCYKYGFIIRYPNGKESITGYMYEPWHIRYVGVDIATKLYNNGNWITLEEYLGITSKY